MVESSSEESEESSSEEEVDNDIMEEINDMGENQRTCLQI